MDMGRLKKVI